MKEIPLTRGMVAVVDDEDYELVAGQKWYAAKQPNTFYAARTVKVNGRKTNIWMHRVINKTPDGLKTDHKDGDGLNNRKSNLRSVTHTDNMINNTRWKIGRSQYRGVSFHIRNGRWIAQITVNKRNIYIGGYSSEYDAHIAYEARRAELRRGKLYRK